MVEVAEVVVMEWRVERVGVGGRVGTENLDLGLTGEENGNATFSAESKSFGDVLCWDRKTSDMAIGLNISGSGVSG